MNPTRVFIYPPIGERRDAPGGIPRVIEAQHDHLPQFGIELVSKPEDAQVIASHITIPAEWLQRFARTPIVNHNHGVYWEENTWPPKYGEVNRQVMELLRSAVVTTVPSEWVAQSLRRASMRDVRVVPHGIDLASWPMQPGTASQGYVLWNKFRVDPVCDPEPVMQLALALPDVPFVTTFSQRNFSPRLEDHPPTSPNMTVTGSLPFPEAAEYVRRAGVYLATTRETFGIGTLEAMASGVPVVGYSNGGNADLVHHGVDGWLVEPGDIAGLAEGVRTILGDRARYSSAARKTAEAYGWDGPAEQYADIYREVAARAAAEAAAPTVSVVVPAFKMGDYLSAALQSVAEQTLIDLECVVYVDASPDERDEAIAQAFAEHDPRFRVIVGETNVRQSVARNLAIAATTGRYVLPLDGDDQLEPHSLELLAQALDRDATLHIAYGNVRFVEEDGRTPRDYGAKEGPGYSGWPPQFDAKYQLSELGYNLIPICAMYRRDVWRLTAGYRRHWRTHEDPDFWTRATSYGFRAEKVTTADTLIYRDRAGSLSKQETQVRSWPRWYPWTRHPELTPGASLVGDGIPSFDPAVVNVVIPVGPGHVPLLLDAIDSVDAQEYRWWECTVINDSGEALPLLPSWVRVVERPGHARFGGVAAARNAGIRASKARLYLPLDADDFLMPSALALMVGAHEETGASIYSDFWEDPETPNVWKVYEVDDYRPEHLTKGLRWAVTQLTTKAAWEQVGGYDESLPAWEDWGFQLALAAAGICSRRLALPLFAYRKHAGFRRADNLQRKSEYQGAFMARWGKYWQGEQLMACQTCGSGRGSTIDMAPAANPGDPDTDATLMEYIGDAHGARLAYRGRATQAQYYFMHGEPQWVHKADAELFLQTTDFREIERRDATGVAVSDPADITQPFMTADGPPPGPFSQDAPLPAGVLGIEPPAQAMGQADGSDSAPSSEAPKSEPPHAGPRFARGDLRLMRRGELDEIASHLNLLPGNYRNADVLVDAILEAQGA